LARIFGCIRENYAVADGAEVTVEMNPEDVVVDEALSLAGGLANGTFNRVSLGIQTFDDDLLRLLRRRHSAERAVEAVKSLQLVGAQNISIDLIYGLPGQTLELWERDLDVAFSLGVQHLSAYALSYEEGTPLWRMRQRGEVQEAADELSVRMYERLCQRAREAGFEHYEISNFALPGYHSRHNSSYWTGEAYLGFGPGAHSFDGRRTRRSNHSSLSDYLSAGGGGEVPHDVEVLSDEELYEEAVMCGLRTCRGVDLAEIGHRFGRQRLDYLLRQASSHLRGGRLAIEHEHLRLTEAALMISDDVMSDLMA